MCLEKKLAAACRGAISSRCGVRSHFIWLAIASILVGEVTVHGQTSKLHSTRLVDTDLFSRGEVEQVILQRIGRGVYDGYEAELCVEDAEQCQSDIFAPYRQVGDDGQARYELTVTKDSWEALPGQVKDAVVREIIYYTWGHPTRTFSPLDVSIDTGPVGASPLEYLSPYSCRRYLRFASPAHLQGGRGRNSYGPNCWYNAISAIVDSAAVYSRSQMLEPAAWDHPRFMGPTEFRQHMQQFDEVVEPQFGDIVRYYTTEPIYEGLIYGGGVHAAVYVGTETFTAKDGAQGVREIALTKNGQSDLDFLIFQDVRGMDEDYLPAPGNNNSNAGTQIKKGYFRVNRGAAVLDPAVEGRSSAAFDAYMVDLRNYVDRFLCLAGVIAPPASNGATCYSYPHDWLTLPSTKSALPEGSAKSLRSSRSGTMESNFPTPPKAWKARSQG